MKNLSKYFLPELTDNTILRVTMDFLNASSHLLPNFYYQVLDETMLVNKELISLQILIVLDQTGDYYLIINESSEASRWVNAEDMLDYSAMRVAGLEEHKSNIMVMQPSKTEQYFLIQYYVCAGRCGLRRINTLVNKIISQVTQFRNNYNNENDR